MKNYLNPVYVMSVAFVLVGCATSTPAPQAPAQLAPNAPAAAPQPTAVPIFADSELAKLPGVQAAMDRCRAQNKKHKVITRVADSGPMKGSLAIEVKCDE